MWGVYANPAEDDPVYGVCEFKSDFGRRKVEYGVWIPLMPLVSNALCASEPYALKSMPMLSGGGFRITAHLA